MDCSQIDADYETTELVIEDRPVTVEKSNLLDCQEQNKTMLQVTSKACLKQRAFLRCTKIHLTVKSI